MARSAWKIESAARIAGGRVALLHREFKGEDQFALRVSQGATTTLHILTMEDRQKLAELLEVEDETEGPEFPV